MSQSQTAAKIDNTTSTSNVTVSINSSGTVTLDPGPSATTSPASLLYVNVASPYNGICARTGVVIDNGVVKDQGTCQCANVVGTTHIGAGASLIKSEAGGTSGQDYKLVPLNGGVLAFGTTGDIHVGSGG
jgi:hypothetical protein